MSNPSRIEAPRTFRRRPPHWVSLAIFAAFLVACRCGQIQFTTDEETPAEDVALTESTYEVVRAVDGDTIIVWDAGERRPVRLMGIDTPEVFDPAGTGERLDHAEPFGPEASQFTKDFISGGEVRLRFGRRRLDQYDRLLAYVFVGDRMLNEELAREGLAEAKTYAGDESPLSRRIEQAESEAREARRGIWSQGQ